MEITTASNTTGTSLPLAPSLPEVERRSASLEEAEFRESSDKMVFEGRAAVFNEWAKIGSFEERVMRGAFRKAINRGTDVVFALNHNLDFTMARTTVEEGPGSLVLSESGKGLEVYAELAPTSTARDLKVLVESRVINEMSFSWPRGATVDEWNTDYTKRSISEFTDLIDVSPVVGPAYAGTSASMRDLWGALRDQIHRDSSIPGEERAKLEGLLAQYDPSTLYPGELHRQAEGPEQAETAPEIETEEETDSEPSLGRHSLAAVERRLIDIRLKGALR